jgi:hypothetical protein
MTAGAQRGDLELLRLHVEAVWDVRLPPLAPGVVAELLPGGSAPEWTVYVAEVAGSRVRIWRPDAGMGPPKEREARMARAEEALALPASAPAPPGVTREVALRLATAPALDLAVARSMARRLAPADRALLAAFDPDVASCLDRGGCAPVCGVVADGRLASLAHSSRRTATACELGVYTLPEARRRGSGLAVTVLWTRAVMDEGLVPLYSALAVNAASLALAAAAGYRPFARAAYLGG